MFFALNLNAETFRVRQTHIADMSKEVATHTKYLGFNDVLAITLPDKNQFLKGVELEFKIPSDMLVYKHCIGFSFIKIFHRNRTRTLLIFQENAHTLILCLRDLAWFFKCLLQKITQ